MSLATCYRIPLCLYGERYWVNIKIQFCCLSKWNVCDTGTENAQCTLKRCHACVWTSKILWIVVQNEIFVVYRQLTNTIREYLHPRTVFRCLWLQFLLILILVLQFLLLFTTCLKCLTLAVDVLTQPRKCLTLYLFHTWWWFKVNGELWHYSLLNERCYRWVLLCKYRELFQFCIAGRWIYVERIEEVTRIPHAPCRLLVRLSVNLYRQRVNVNTE